MTVLTMYQPFSFYFTAGQAFLQKKEYYDAIIYLRKAMKLDPREEHILELALAYSEIDAFNESTLLYLRLLEKKKYLEYSLALARDCRQHAFTHGNYDFPDNGWLIANSHKYNVGQVPKLSFFWENLNYELLKELTTPKYVSKDILRENYKIENEDLSYIDTISRRNIKKAIQAYEYFNLGDYDKAIQVCFEISDNSEEYEIVLDILARAALKNEDFELAETAAKEIYARDKFNPTSYEVLLKIWTIDKQHTEEEIKSFANRAINDLIALKGYAVLRFFATHLSLLGYNDLAIQAAESAFLDNSMDQLSVSCYVGTLVNSKNLKQARVLTRKYIQIFPNDLDIRFLNWYVSSKSVDNDVLYFSSDFSLKVSEELITLFHEEFSVNCQSDNEEIVLTSRAYDILDVMFAFQRPEPIIEALSLNNYNEEDTFQKYLIEKLKHIDIRNSCKATLIFSLLISKRTINKKVIFPYGSSIISSYLRSYSFPENAKGSIFRDVYAAVYTHLLLHKEILDPDKIKNLIDLMMNSSANLRSYGALCTILMFYYLKSKNISMNVKETVALFGTNIATFKKYLNHFAETIPII